MDFGETLLAAQRNSRDQHQHQDNVYYRAKFEPPKKEQKPAARLSANIQKFLAKKEEEERRKQEEARQKRDELLAMRDPKATRKIQKMLKVIKSANKSVLAEATDHEHTAVTRGGAEQPDQDDYGYESQEAAAIYSKMMDKYSKLPEEEKFPSRGGGVKKDLEGTRERMKQALLREDEPQPRHRQRKSAHTIEKEESPPPQEKKPEKEKPKFRKPAPPPMDFNQLLKLAEQKKSEPLVLPVPVIKKEESESGRLMTKRQKREYEEEQARREAKMRRDEAKAKGSKQERPRPEPERPEKKSESTPTFTRIPKLSDRNAPPNKIVKPSSETVRKPLKEEPRKMDRERSTSYHRQEVPKSDEKKKIELKSQNTYRIDKTSSEKKTIRPKADDRQKIYRDDDRLKQKLDDRTKAREPDRSRSYSKDENRSVNGHSSQAIPKQTSEHSRKIDVKEKLLAKEKSLFGNGRDSPKINGGVKKPELSKMSKPSERPREFEKKELPKSKVFTNDRKPATSGNSTNVKSQMLNDRKPAMSGNSSNYGNNVKPQSNNKGASKTFDFDKHVNSLKKASVGNAKDDRERPGGVKKPDAGRQPQDAKRKFPPGDVRRNQAPKRRMIDSESEYDSELDDFIDDGDDDADYSKHIKEIFGYDKNRYRDTEEDVDAMESSFAQQMREEYISKKIGIMEDLEDMRQEAMEKKRSKKRRRISDD